MTPPLSLARSSQTPIAPSTALEDLLDELAGLLVGIELEVYIAKPAPGVSGSIGEHVRHLLDHVGAFVASGPLSPLSYDRRERGTPVERDPGAALRQMIRLKASLQRERTRDLDESIVVSSTIAAGVTVTGWSTRGRELAFVVAHSIHHQAMIALLLAFHGLAVPPRFGFAPSTPAS